MLLCRCVCKSRRGTDGTEEVDALAPLRARLPAAAADGSMTVVRVLAFLLALATARHVQPWLRAPRTRWRSYEVGAASVPPLRVVGALARTPRCTPRRTRMCRQECGACAAHGQECGVGAPPHLRQLLVFGAQLLGALECRVQARGAGARGQVATRRRLTVVRETRASPHLDSVQLRTRFSTRVQLRLPDAASRKPHSHLRIAPTASQDGCASQDGRTIWVHVVLRWQPAS